MDPRPLLATNGRIAGALIDVLVSSSDPGAALRAIAAGGVDEAGLCDANWLPEETLGAMFRAAGGDERLPQRVGRALVCSPRAGFLLRYGGVATPEKAYRRSDQMLARETRGASYEVAEVASGRARVLFHPAAGESPESRYCALRRGMLEAVPTVYGLLPARVREAECASQGAEYCVYEVRWTRSSRRGLIAGGIAGLCGASAVAVLTAPFGPALLGLSVELIAVLAAGLVCAAAGRSFDLARQLDAVAGARSGQLALLDQVDRTLAEKMDQFARLEAAERVASDAAGVGTMGHGGARGGPGVSSACEASEGFDFQPVDLAGVVRRAVESQRSVLESGPTVVLELPDDPLVLDGEPVQLEMVVVQLICHAAAAMSAEADDRGEPVESVESLESGESGHAVGQIRVSLQAAGDKLELVVEDDGPPIDAATVDEVFDPFLGEASATSSRGLGLAAAYRVVKSHGGELRLESAEGRGTRVTALLPLRRGGLE